MKHLLRSLLESAALVVLYVIGLELLSRLSIMNLLLSPSGAGSMLALGLAFLFLLLRLFLLTCLPGFVLARWYLLASAPPPASPSATSVQIGSAV